MEKAETEKCQNEIEIQRRKLQIKCIVEDILDEIGLRLTFKGYKLWVTAVTLSLEKEYRTLGELYVDIAEKHGTTSRCVAEALGLAQEDARDRIQKYFKLQYKVTNLVFLECLKRKTELIITKKKLLK